MLKKSIQAVRVSVFVLLMCNVSMFAQQSEKPAVKNDADESAQANKIDERNIELLRKDLREQRKEITAQNLPLTADEATKFWPIFDQYRKEAIKPNDDRWAMLKDYGHLLHDTAGQALAAKVKDVSEFLITLGPVKPQHPLPITATYHDACH